MDGDSPLLSDTESDQHRFRRIKLKESVPPDIKDALQTMHYAKDKGWLLGQTIASRGNKSDDLLGEMQLAFVCLLVAQNYDGFEHWKTILHLILSSSTRYYPHLDFFVRFLGIFLHYKYSCYIKYSTKH